MAVPQNKNELLNAIETNFNKLIQQLDKVPVEQTQQPTLDGHVKGSQMSICNLLAYLIGWNELVLKWLSMDASGKTIDFPETGYKWNQLGQLAQKFYQDYSDLNYALLIKRLSLSKTRMVELNKTKTNAELYEKSWYNQWTMGRMIQLNTASPYLNAKNRVSKWLKIQNFQPRV